MADPENSAEEWRDIPGFDGYQVSNFGRVRSIKILKPWFNTSTGYFQVGLGRGFRTTLHRLVCTVFHGDPPAEGLDVAHNDGNKINNLPDNLRWATRAENTADAVRHGTSKLMQYRTDGHVARRGPSKRKGLDSPNAKLSRSEAQEIMARRERGETMRSLAVSYGVGKSTVFRVLKGRN